MGKDDSQPKTQQSGSRPPPQPPHRTTVGLGPDDDPERKKPQPKKETVRINLPPKPSAAPTVKLPTLPTGGPSVAGMVTLAEMKKGFLMLVVGVLIVLASILAYLSIYFTASQPENYGALRYKIYAWICIISFFAGLLLCLWSIMRVAVETGRNRVA